jgi:pimeloyl-ACP methyl ester carboxylesterase
MMRHGRLRYLLGSAFHGLAWTEWGPHDGDPVVCVHGLTRNGRDFDTLAAALAERGRRVYCPDLPGRGGSDWLPDPMLYVPPSYVVALAHLLARIDGPVDWVGTSLGGICGMLVAAGQGNPIRRLVLNDIGAYVPEGAVTRIAEYVSQEHHFADLAGVEAHLRLVHAPFGPLTDAEWRHMAETSHRRLPDGSFAMHYDPAIAVPLTAAPPGPIELRPIWAMVTAPVLLIHGEESDILEAATAATMVARGEVVLATLPGVGHAPALHEAGQIGLITTFLEG